MVANRFTVGRGEKVLIVSGRKKDFIPWMQRHPNLKDRIVFSDDDDRRDDISAGVKGIFFGKFLNHADRNRLVSLAQKRGLFYRFFNTFSQMKMFLETSMILSPNGDMAKVEPVAIENIQEMTESIPLAVSESSDSGSEPGIIDISTSKRQRGAVINFVLANADFSVKSVKDEIARLLELARQQGGITKSVRSMTMCFYTCRKLNAATLPNSDQTTESTHCVEDPSLSNLQLLKDGLDTEEVAAEGVVPKQAVTTSGLIGFFDEIVKNFQSLRNALLELEGKSNRIDDLKNEIAQLKLDNDQLRSGLKKQLADIVGNL